MKFKKLYNTVDECYQKAVSPDMHYTEWTTPLVEDEQGDKIVWLTEIFDADKDEFVVGIDVDLDHNGASLFYEPEENETIEELYQAVLKHLEEIHTIWYAIANCENPEDCSTDFYMWDTKYDVCYECDVYDSLVENADKCRTLKEAEDRAKDVLSTIWDNEVYIVRVYEDEDGDMDYAEFVKMISKEKI